MNSLLMRILADDDRRGGGAEASLVTMPLEETREKNEFPLKVLLLEIDARGITDVGDLGDRFLVALVLEVARGASAAAALVVVVVAKPDSLHVDLESRRISRTRQTPSESGVRKQFVPWNIARRNCSLQVSSNCFLIDAIGEGLLLCEYLR